MTCRAVQSKLSAYLDGELTGFEMLDIRSHLCSCPACDEEAEQLRRLKSALGNLAEQKPQDDFAERLIEQVFHAAPAAKRKKIPLAMISSLAFVAALLVSLVALHSQPTAARVKLAAQALDQSNFDVSRDQAYQAGGDPFNDGSFIITASANSSNSR